MKFIADLHIHSKYSRATSNSMTPENLWKWSQIKGIGVLGTGDFTHPEWLKELKEKLEDSGTGLYTLKDNFQLNDVPLSCKAEMSFMLTAEISCIYSKNSKLRRIHSILLAPDFETVERINSRLSKIGNLSADGRPILGLDAKILLKIILDVSDRIMLIPAHAWTPHFAVFGAGSGFDSLDECFEELTPHVHAIETGLSSDPAMNWRLSALDKITLTSHSDAHSLQKIGREANILATDLSYHAITESIKTRKGFLKTIEFFPEEGKYHYDGHRFCKTSLPPEETIKNKGLCPVCGKKVTIGVMHRIEKLADRKPGFRPADAPDFLSVIPLIEIISETLNVGVSAKKTAALYFKLIENIGSEFKILTESSIEDIEKASSPRLAEAVACMREGKVHISPGYDGEYGKIKIFEEIEKPSLKTLTRLF